MSSLFRIISSAALLAGGMFGSTITQTDSLALKDVGTSFGAPVAFSGFDPALGQLTGVTVSLQASFNGTVGVENTSNVPDMAGGIIAGTVTVATLDNAFQLQVSPSAAGPLHDLTAFDGVVDFGGTSGATDSVSGTAVSNSSLAPNLEFLGNNQVFLTLTASSFAIVDGMEQESVTETANADATVQVTYSYTPVPEPSGFMFAGLGIPAMLWLASWFGGKRAHDEESIAGRIL